MGEATIRALVLTDVHQLQAIVPAWRGLLSRSKSPQPTQTPAWLLSWWSIFGEGQGRRLRVVVLWSMGQIIAIVPLLRRVCLRGRALPTRILESIGTGEPTSDEIYSEYVGPIVRAGYEEQAMRALAGLLVSGKLGSWDELSLCRMSADDPSVICLAEALSERHVSVDVRATDTCCLIRLPSSWDDYLRQLDSKHRYFVKRTLRDLTKWAEPGDVVLRCAQTPFEVASAWQVLKSLHAHRWNGAGVFGSERFCAFHRLLLCRLLRGEDGFADLMWLEANGVPVAALYNIVFRGTVHFYQGGRNMDLPSHLRPGIAIHLYAIRRAIEEGYHTYDFLARPHPYKRKLAPDSAHSLVTLTATGPSKRARAIHTIRDLLRALRGFRARPAQNKV